MSSNRLAGAAKSAIKAVGSTLQANRGNLERKLPGNGQVSSSRKTDSKPATIRVPDSDSIYSAQYDETISSDVGLISGPKLDPDDGSRTLEELAAMAPEFRSIPWTKYLGEHQRLILRMAIRWKQDDPRIAYVKPRGTRPHASYDNPSDPKDVFTVQAFDKEDRRLGTYHAHVDETFDPSPKSEPKRAFEASVVRTREPELSTDSNSGKRYLTKLDDKPFKRKEGSKKD